MNLNTIYYLLLENKPRNKNQSITKSSLALLSHKTCQEYTSMNYIPRKTVSALHILKIANKSVCYKL